MNVRCERCKIEYELDDHAIGDHGQSVMCSTCGHTFFVSRARRDCQSGWMLLECDGTQTPIENMEVLKETVLSGQISPDDFVRQGEGEWQRIADIPDLRQALLERGTWPGGSKTSIPPPPRTNGVSSVPPPVYGLSERLSSTPPPPHEEGPEIGLKALMPVPAEELLGKLPQPKPATRPSKEPRVVAARVVPREARSRLLPLVGFLLVFAFLGAMGIYIVHAVGSAPGKIAFASHARRIAQSSMHAATVLAASAPVPEPAVPAALPQAAPAGEATAVETAGEPAPDVEEVKIPPGTTLDQLLERAAKYKEKGKTNEAIALYKRVLSEDPHNARGLSGLGYAYMDQGRLGQALDVFRMSISLNPRFGQGLIGLGQTFQTMGRKDLALQYYRRFLSVDPNSPQHYMVLRKIAELENRPGLAAEEDSTGSAPQPADLPPIKE